jgi:hypothetical protein
MNPVCRVRESVDRVPSDPATVLNALSTEIFSPDNMQLGECKVLAWEDWRSESPVIAVHDRNGYPAAGISGRLAMVDGCLLIGDSVALVAGRDHVEPEAAVSRLRILTPRAGRDEFSGGGGGYMREDLSGLDGLDVDSV